jgi:hypothetical protein
MKNVFTMLAMTTVSVTLFVVSPYLNASELKTEESQPIAYSLSKKINKEIKICIENGSPHTHAFESQKHLKMMMPKTIERCEKGIQSACDVKKSVLLAMEVANNKG